MSCEAEELSGGLFELLELFELWDCFQCSVVNYINLLVDCATHDL